LSQATAKPATTTKKTAIKPRYTRSIPTLIQVCFDSEQISQKGLKNS